MSALRLARGRLREERGFTLTEMLVALAIGTATLTVIMNLVVASHAASSRVVARVDGTQRGRVAMEQATQRLRSQVCLGSNAPIIAGNQDSVTFYADLGDEQFRPEKRRLFVSGSDLREQIWEGTGTPPSVTYPATPTRERVVLQDVEPVKEGAATLP